MDNYGRIEDEEKLRYEGPEEVEIGGQKVKAHRILMESSSHKHVFWMGDDLRLLKSKSDIGMMVLTDAAAAKAMLEKMEAPPKK